jgi:hypothetical protein
LAIAELAGGDWPMRARAAAIRFSGDSEAAAESTGAQLLRAIKVVFETLGVDRITSEKLAEELAKDKDSPWAAYGKTGKPITHGRSPRCSIGTVSAPTVFASPASAPPRRATFLHGSRTLSRRIWTLSPIPPLPIRSTGTSLQPRAQVALFHPEKGMTCSGVKMAKMPITTGPVAVFRTETAPFAKNTKMTPRRHALRDRPRERLPTIRSIRARARL